MASGYISQSNPKFIPAGQGYQLNNSYNGRKHYPNHHGAGKDEWIAMSMHHTDY